MARDYYSEARNIANMLEQEGFIAEANGVREAIEAGSTATEIMMEIRWRLNRLKESNLSIGDRIMNRICELESTIAIALDLR